MSEVDEQAKHPQASALEGLPRLVGEFAAKAGVWATLEKLDALPAAEASTLLMRGVREVVRNLAVRDFLAGENRMACVPRLTAEFLADFEKFDLTAQEGYLVSLVDGRSSLQDLLKLSPHDSFTTIFTLARLRHKKVLTTPS